MHRCGAVSKRLCFPISFPPMDDSKQPPKHRKDRKLDDLAYLRSPATAFYSGSDEQCGQPDVSCTVSEMSHIGLVQACFVAFWSTAAVYMASKKLLPRV